MVYVRLKSARQPQPQVTNQPQDRRPTSTASHSIGIAFEANALPHFSVQTFNAIILLSNLCASLDG